VQSLGGHRFILNVCQSVSRRLWNIDFPDPDNVGGFMRQDHGDFSVGWVSNTFPVNHADNRCSSVNTTLDIRDSSPLLLLASGSPCPIDEEMLASTTINFICDTSVTGSGNPTVIAQLPTEDEDACEFVLNWRTPVSVPSLVFSYTHSNHGTRPSRLLAPPPNLGGYMATSLSFSPHLSSSSCST
jgi:cation-dependent mannose-6-phosphate receptor